MPKLPYFSSIGSNKLRPSGLNRASNADSVLVWDREMRTKMMFKIISCVTSKETSILIALIQKIYYDHDVTVKLRVDFLFLYFWIS